MSDRTLYPALPRLEEGGWVDSEWGVSKNNRRAKYYSLPTSGRERLRVEAGSWRRYAAAVFAALDARPLR